MSFNVLYNSSNDGVAPGGLRDRDKIKVLICYLVDKTDNGTGKDFICGVLQKCGAANYFEASQGFDELTADIEDQVEGRTQVPVTLTTTDLHAVKAAETINRELDNLQKERNEYLDGNRKVAEAVTGISHDIRTPLTAINSYLDLMADEEDEELKGPDDIVRGFVVQAAG